MAAPVLTQITCDGEIMKTSTLKYKGIAIVIGILIFLILSSAFIVVSAGGVTPAKPFLIRECFIVFMLGVVLFQSYRMTKRERCPNAKGFNFFRYLSWGHVNGRAIWHGLSGGLVFSLMQMFNYHIGLKEFETLFKNEALGEAFSMALGGTLSFEVSRLVSDALKVDGEITPPLIKLLGNIIGIIIGLIIIRISDLKPYKAH